MTDRRRANLDVPTTIDEARRRAVEVEVEIAALQSILDNRFRFHDDGSPFTPEEYVQWRKRVSSTMTWYVRERTIIDAYIHAYEKEVKAEEEVERQRMELETRRRVAEQKLKRAEALSQEQESQRRWKTEMIAQYGTAKLPKNITQAMELEQLRVERRTKQLALQQDSERSRKRREAHKEWLQRIGIEDSIDGLDSENLLRHAARVLRQLKERRALTPEELVVLDVIEQRYLIIASMETAQTTPRE